MTKEEVHDLVTGKVPLDTVIDQVNYNVVEGRTVTICTLHIFGFSITAAEDCADSAVFDAELGKKYAREAAELKAKQYIAFLYKYLCAQESESK